MFLSRNSTVEDFYKYSANGSTALGYYYLNSFDNLLTSGVTLFELTIVNNWFILMNSYALVVSPWSRAYFMLFYLFTMIVLTIVVASVLEAFRFRIQYKRQTSKREGKIKELHFKYHTASVKLMYLSFQVYYVYAFLMRTKPLMTNFLANVQCPHISKFCELVPLRCWIPSILMPQYKPHTFMLCSLGSSVLFVTGGNRSLTHIKHEFNISSSPLTVTFVFI